MTNSDEGMPPQPEEGSTEEEREGVRSEPGAAQDVSQQTAPPGNPETDDQAVEKGEDQLGRVVGR